MCDWQEWPLGFLSNLKFDDFMTTKLSQNFTSTFYSFCPLFPCHSCLSILFSTSLLRHPFGFIYSRHANLRFDLSVRGYQPIVALHCFISDLISCCISQYTHKELCFHRLTTLFKNTGVYYVSRVNKAL